jgi:hypothetical protein
MIRAPADSRRGRAGILGIVTPEMVMSRASGSLRFGYRTLELDLAGKGPRLSLGRWGLRRRRVVTDEVGRGERSEMVLHPHNREFERRG